MRLRRLPRRSGPPKTIRWSPLVLCLLDFLAHGNVIEGFQIFLKLSNSIIGRRSNPRRFFHGFHLFGVRNQTANNVRQVPPACPGRRLRRSPASHRAKQRPFPWEPRRQSVCPLRGFPYILLGTTTPSRPLS